MFKIILLLTCILGELGQNQNVQLSCKKNNDQAVQHVLKNEMSLIQCESNTSFLMTSGKCEGLTFVMQNK